MDKPTLVLDRLVEGIGRLDEDRLFAENETMARFLAANGHAGSRSTGAEIGALTCGEAIATALSNDGDEVVVLEVGGGVWRVQCIRDGDHRWLLAVPAGAGSDAPQQSADRLHSLAALGQGLVHELANRIGVIVAFAEQLETRLAGPDREHLAHVTSAAADSLATLRLLVRMLEREPAPSAPTLLTEVVTGAARLLAKHLERRNVTISTAADSPSLRVRAPAADLVQAVVTAVLFALRSTSGGVVQLGVERLAAGRAVACIQVVDHGDAAIYAHLADAIGSRDATAARGLLTIPGSDAELFRTVALLRRHGGDLQVATRSGRRTLRLCLPEVRP